MRSKTLKTKRSTLRDTHWVDARVQTASEGVSCTAYAEDFS